MLTGLAAGHGVGGRAVMSALVEAVALRAVEDDERPIDFDSKLV